jgi:hypothetical protein
MDSDIEHFLAKAVEEKEIEKPENLIKWNALIAIHAMGFTDWMQRVKGLQFGDAERYRKLCTEYNFKQYLIDEGIAYMKCRTDESKISEIGFETCEHYTYWEGEKYGALHCYPVENNNTVLYEIYFKGGDDDANQWEHKHIGYWKSHCPVVATGFIVYWIIHRKESATDVYSAYYSGLRQMFVEKENQKAGAYKRDLDYEFYQKHVEDEKYRVSRSQDLFDYLPEQDKKIIQSYIDDYFKWVNYGFCNLTMEQ